MFIFNSVKGFTFFCQELGHAAQAVDYIIDMTTLYIPKPPPMKRYALSGRLHDRLDMILRVYKISDMPKEKAELDQWLRDRWTEKDKLSIKTILHILAQLIGNADQLRLGLPSCLFVVTLAGLSNIYLLVF